MQLELYGILFRVSLVVSFRVFFFRWVMAWATPLELYDENLGLQKKDALKGVVWRLNYFLGMKVLRLVVAENVRLCVGISLAPHGRYLLLCCLVIVGGTSDNHG